MNDPITDLQSLLTASFTPANVTSISTVPQVKKGREYDTLTEAVIAVLNWQPVFDGITGDYRTEIYTLVCELQINIDSHTESVKETAIDETIEEIDSVFNNNNKNIARTFDANILPMIDYLKPHHIGGISIEISYMAVGI